jgi:stage II sporulation protein D
MKRYIHAILFSLLLIIPLFNLTAGCPKVFAASGARDEFDIAVVRNAAKVEISGADYAASKDYAAIFTKNKIAKNFTSTVTFDNGKLFINSEKAGIKEFSIYPKKNGPVKINGNAFRGKFLVKSNEEGITVINTVAIEDYLKAVVPSEMEKSADIEALKAQAVVARTYAIATRGKHKKAGYDLCNTTCCQVYKGVREENAKTDKAVADTKGLVIFHAGKPINAYYCASCGGYTELAEEAWPGAQSVQYAKVIKCPHCLKDSKMSWTYKIKVSEFITKMRAAGFTINDINSAELYDKTRSGRFNTVEMRGSFGTLYYSAEIFRKIFGNNNIRSSFFNIIIDKPKTVTKNFKFSKIDDIIKARNNYNNNNSQNSHITFTGSGYGHGVGMCQHGAKKMAAGGKNFRHIINYYFTKEVNIKKIY